jgi:hypothetical protein
MSHEHTLRHSDGPDRFANRRHVDQATEAPEPEDPREYSTSRRRCRYVGSRGSFPPASVTFCSWASPESID